jgi:uncharacterized protein
MNATATVAAHKVNTLAELLAFLRAHAVDFRSRYTMNVDGVFGSFARGEQTSDSDVDLLVSFERLPALWDFYGIAQELETQLGRRVHLVHNDGSQFIGGIRAELVKT